MEPKPLPPVARLALGLAIVAGAAVIASLASPSTMTLTRNSTKTVTVTVETRLFNLYRIGGFQIDGAESVEVVESVVPPTGTGPDAPYGISVYFVTPNGRINHGVRQKLFDKRVSDIRSFFAGDAPSATLSVNGPADRLAGFIIVQLSVIVMSLIGMAAMWSGLTGLFGQRARRS